MITKQLDLGTRDPQVLELQKFLNSIGISVAQSGPGSPGNETDYFGPLTQAAVQKFQAKYGIVSSGTPESTGYGRVGPKTLTKLTEVGGQTSAHQKPATLNTTDKYIQDPNNPNASIPNPNYKAPVSAKVEPSAKTEVQKIEEQKKEVETKIAETKSILDQALSLGYKSGQEILIDPNTNKVLPPPKEKEEGAGGTTTGDTYTVPDWLANNEYFKKLSPDEQKYIINYYNVLRINDKENQDRLTKALDDAKVAADPYFKEKIRMAQDELTLAIGGQTADLASKQRDLKQRIEDIKSDLTTGQGRLSVDEQAELGRQQRKYEYQLENLRETAATSGLTFSSKRALAEGRLEVEQQDIVESTKREFQRKLEDLQTQAARGDLEAQNQLKDYERIYGENVTKLGRAGETYLGTAGLPAIEGYKPLGGVTGTIEEEKLKDITQRAEALASLRNPFL